MKNSSITALLAISLLTFNSNSHANTSEQTPLPRLLEEIKMPVPIERASPRFPKNAASIGAEGWVQMSLVIGTDGIVEEAVILDSGGERAFRREALRAIKKWKYEPAMQNGEPIQQCTEVQFDFKLIDGGVSKKFAALYKEATNLLENNELAKAEKLIFNQKIDDRSNSTELDWLENIRAIYFHKTGEKENQLRSLNRAIPKPKHKKFSTVFPKDVFAQQLFNVFALELSLNKFADAIKTYRSFKHIDEEIAKPYMTKMEPIYQQIIVAIKSDEPIIQYAKVHERGLWRHQLVRNSFVIDSIENGELSQVDIHCNNKRIKYTIEPQNQWTIPESWGQCRIIVNGDDGTSFKLYELHKPQEEQLKVNVGP